MSEKQKDDLVKIFTENFDNLNEAQRLAVETTEGPVMVVAGPGTGKTQILALRIANILKKGVSPADGILCLTFTNSGVSEMKERLEKYIGPLAKNVTVSTFHSFAYNIIEKNYEFLDFEKAPEMLSDEEAIFVIDEILNNNDWEYISPRGNKSMYFNDLKQLVSILKREGVTESDLLSYIEEDIKNIKEDPDNISTRGESKGKLKKEIEKKIDQLNKTLEVVEFYKLYEKRKKELALIDYDDVLKYAVKLVEDFENVRDDIRENYLYVLVDEHQDSSGIQNNFLKAVWQGTERPNIFIVGDDRQLIYAFSGAKLSYFQEFSNTFGKTKEIILTENYRSTSPILALADDLLKSSITNEKLKSNKKGDHKISLSGYSYPREEIIGAGLYFKQKISEGIDPNECALLVPKNHHVRSAIETLSGLNLPVSSIKSLSLFSLIEGDYLRRVLELLANPSNSTILAKTLLDKTSGIPYLTAHNFLKNNKLEQLTIEDLMASGSDDGLFVNENYISKWGSKLKNWINDLANEKPSTVISIVGNELLIKNSIGLDSLLSRVEIVRSFIHLAITFEEKHKKATLSLFLEYLNRLESYNSNIELVKFGNNNGIKVMTLHKSKGLEYECVWVAHMNEETLMSEKKGGFTLPEKIKEHMSKRNLEMAKRELYVAITRAKEFCVLSYATKSHNGSGMELASIIRELPDFHFNIKDHVETEKEILSFGPEIYVKPNQKEDNNIINDLNKLVSENYQSIKISVSMLNNFLECSRKWYFRNFLKLPEIKPVYLSLGTVVHSMIEFILKSKNIPDEIDLKSKIKFEFEKAGINNENDLRKISFDAFGVIKNWIDNYYSHLLPDFKSERSVTFIDKKNFPHLLMYGKIDLTEYLPNGEVYVTDFKTGSSKTTGVIEKISEEGRMSDLMRQLTMYSYLIQGDNKDIKVTNSKLLFLESDPSDKNAFYQTRITDEQIDLLKRDIKYYDESISNNSWINLKCNFKPYGSKIHECEYCKMWDSIKR